VPQYLPFTPSNQYSHFQPKNDARQSDMKGEFTLVDSGNTCEHSGEYDIEGTQIFNHVAFF